MPVESTPTTDQDVKPSSSGLVFQLHPLVLINVSDHFNRVRANTQQGSGRVYGCLLGQQNGREVSVSNSFELLVSHDNGSPVINEEFLTRKQEQYKQTFSDLDIVGWYATGAQADASDKALHHKIMELNESPVFLLLDTNISPRHKDLPVSLLESELHNVDGTQQFIFVKAEYSIQTSEAERIAVNQVAKVLPAGNDSGADQIGAHYTNLVSAIRMLNERISGLLQNLRAMSEGRAPLNYRLLREASSLLERLPAIGTQGFQAEYLMEFNDALLAVLLSSMTRGSNALLDIVDKSNVAYGRP